ncbi:MAG: hypothetical protein KF696_11475 [Planctomycetes bacterium]|nr:hypothetical protein [Planctomycetota bacterium]MCW8135214.1 hypothetical protein [Planctomycetota bacterium]
MKQTIALLALLLAGFQATACTLTARPVLATPDTTVAVMREAFDKDDVGLFLHTLGRPVLKEYSEHIIRIGWSDIRPHVGSFVESAKVIEVADLPRAGAPRRPPNGFVEPREGAQLKRVRLAVGDAQEDFLFELEVDDAPQHSKQARGFWIGDRYFVRTQHHSPQTYLVEDSPEKERTHWRLVFPYHAYQQQGALTEKLQRQLAAEKE